MKEEIEKEYQPTAEDRVSLWAELNRGVSQVENIEGIISTYIFS